MIQDYLSSYPVLKQYHAVPLAGINYPFSLYQIVLPVENRRVKLSDLQTS